MSYGVGSDMNYADMILDSVGVANLDEVNLSYMIVSVVIFQKFTWLPHTQVDSKIKDVG